MKKILFVVLGSLSLMACGPSKDKMQRLAEENLELTVDNPEKLNVITISQPDSAFGTGYFTREEVKGMVGNMQAVTDTIMRRTDNMRHFNPNDRYVIGLAERQMRGMAELRSLTAGGEKKAAFSGWKVRVDYSCVDKNGVPYRAQRWCFIDKEGKQLFRSFELPLP